MKYFTYSFIFIFVLLGAFLVATPAQAEVNPFDIQFPIAELGNCGSIDECRSYCDDPSNGERCFAWAQSQGIEVERPQKDRSVESGPGKCTTRRECHSYCENLENIKECVEFSVKEGHMSQKEAERVLRGGPGGCRTEKECKTFCSDPSNNNVCINFAVSEGYMSQKEADRIGEISSRRGPQGLRDHDDFDDGPEINEEKVMKLLEEQGGPGGCATFDECDRYCSNPTNDNECMNFAIKHGLFEGGPEEIEKIRRMQNIVGPGECRGRKCKEYCDEPGHEEECVNFAVENGFMDEEEAREIKKFMQATMDGGPGGCRGRGCEVYCDDPEHGNECFEFAKKNNLISRDEIEEIERFMEMDRGKMMEGDFRSGSFDDHGEFDPMINDYGDFQRDGFRDRYDQAYEETDRREFERFMEGPSDMMSQDGDYNGEFIDQRDYKEPYMMEIDSGMIRTMEDFRKIEQQKIEEMKILEYNRVLESGGVLQGEYIQNQQYEGHSDIAPPPTIDLLPYPSDYINTESELQQNLNNEGTIIMNNTRNAFVANVAELLGGLIVR